jgi:hypothetical protein
MADEGSGGRTIWCRDADVEVDGFDPVLLVEMHPVGRDVGHFADVVAGADGDVGVHGPHAGGFELAGEGELFGGGAAQQGPQELAVFEGEEGDGAGAVGFVARALARGRAPSTVSMRIFSPAARATE